VSADRAGTILAFAEQARAAAAIGSPIYSELLARAGEDVAAGGPIAAVVAGFAGHPVLSALPLRVAGAVHAIVLDGRAPALAAFYPTAGGRFEAAGAWRAFRDVVAAHGDEIRARLGANVQTN
jgi:hypothetical protein